jgi:metallo-beta-lactamase family protein
VLVGYPAEGTRGRRLLDGESELKMLGRYVRVRADVVDLPAFSVHADADELFDWISSADTKPNTVFVVHGEQSASRALADTISERLDWTAAVPRHAERVRLDVTDDRHM